MKSTYKLFGILWDHKDIGDALLCEVCRNKGEFDYKEEWCLFDILGEKRTIKISEILSINDERTWEEVLNKLRCHSGIAIVIDYLPSSKSVASSTLYRRRLSQIYYSLIHALPDCQFSFYISDENLDAWFSLMNTNAKSKNDRSLASTNKVNLNSVI